MVECIHMTFNILIHVIIYDRNGDKVSVFPSVVRQLSLHISVWSLVDLFSVHVGSDCFFFCFFFFFFSFAVTVMKSLRVWLNVCTMSRFFMSGIWLRLRDMLTVTEVRYFIISCQVVNLNDFVVEVIDTQT